jgi:hypothetical protein
MQNALLERLKSLERKGQITVGTVEAIAETLQRFPQNTWFEPRNTVENWDYSTFKDALEFGLVAQKIRPVYDGQGNYNGIRTAFLWNAGLKYTADL